jgi:hypothetical protein
MKGWFEPDVALAVTSLVAVAASACVRLSLGVSFLITAAAAMSVNGARATLASIRVRPVDADDPTSPAAIARTIRAMIHAELLFLAAMSIVYAIVAVIAEDRSLKVFAIAFCVASAAAGPISLIRRRPALWAAAGSLAVGLVVWALQRGRV